jgi:hypothetical protein
VKETPQGDRLPVSQQVGARPNGPKDVPPVAFLKRKPTGDHEMPNIGRDKPASPSETKPRLKVGGLKFGKNK